MSEDLKSNHPIFKLQKDVTVWAHITQELKTLYVLREKSDAQMVKINNAHREVQNRKEANENFTIKAALRLNDRYNSSVELLEKELKSLERAQEKLTTLIQLQEENYLEESRKKRKSLESSSGPPKKVKYDTNDILNLTRGDQVAAKTGQEWILAVVVGPKDGKLEVEDIEDDEDHPGTKKRYHLDPSLIIPITDTPQSIQYPARHEVLALYPASSCFYRANVIMPPSATQGDASGHYIVQFEDDGSFERHVHPRMVLDYPRIN